MKGCHVTCSYEPLDLTGVHKFMDAVTDFVESRQLHVGGGFGPYETDVFVTRNDSKAPCTDADRQALGDFLRKIPFMGTVEVDELEDVE